MYWNIYQIGQQNLLNYYNYHMLKQDPQQQMSLSINSLKQQDKVGKTSNTRQGGDKLVCDSGLTPLTYDIRKDFHRKQLQIDYGEIQRMMKDLHSIQSEFMNQPEEEENGSDDGNKGKKRYNKF
ncbi:unnamed protein product [Paramecium pentaurelia]|uniref:Uncharacterized protein n=1 Tax=Paramecium pentaurelia TaxID=43138 RepID=A0A8S1TC57_9CILI|nr:unnamed protein product [Paramecium pentaurelia]